MQYDDLHLFPSLPVACPTGHYFHQSSGECVECERRFYQDEQAQSQCKPCVDGTFTREQGARSAADCEGLLINTSKLTVDIVDQFNLQCLISLLGVLKVFLSYHVYLHLYLALAFSSPLQNEVIQIT